MKRLWLLCASLFVCGPLLAAGGDAERQASVDPTFTNNGNTYRVRFASPTIGIVLLSSAPARATIISSDTISLGINVWRERFIVNQCTAAALSLFSTASGNPIFNSTITPAVNLSSAGIGTNWISPNNARYFYHQDEIWGRWDPGVAGAVGPNPPCGDGAIISESYYSASDYLERRR